MAAASVGRTALGAAVCRLIEQYEPERTRLSDDPLAAAERDRQDRNWMSEMASAPGIS
jgi:O-methyltransferase involved in polyketide biosynthesis